MAEYIEREALRLAYEKSYQNDNHKIEGASAIHLQEHRHMLHILNKIPAADVEVVKHGRWLNAVEEDPELYGWVPLDTVLCSACRKIDKENSRKTPRCPNCGCKMDLEVTNGLDQH